MTVAVSIFWVVSMLACWTMIAVALWEMPKCFEDAIPSYLLPGIAGFSVYPFINSGVAIAVITMYFVNRRRRRTMPGGWTTPGVRLVMERVLRRTDP